MSEWDWAKRYGEALRYISSPTMGLPGGRDALDYVDDAPEAAVREALRICIRTARQALATEPESEPMSWRQAQAMAESRGDREKAERFRQMAEAAEGLAEALPDTEVVWITHPETAERIASWRERQAQKEATVRCIECGKSGTHRVCDACY